MDWRSQRHLTAILANSLEETAGEGASSRQLGQLPAASDASFLLADNYLRTHPTFLTRKF